MTALAFATLAPMWICGGSGLVLLALAGTTKLSARLISVLATFLAALAAVAAINSFPAPQTSVSLFQGALLIDPAAMTVAVLCAVASLCALLVSSVRGGPEPLVGREWPGLVLLVTTAFMLAACAADLPTLLVSVEIAALGMTALLALGRHAARGAELATKGAVVGAAALGLMTMGIALIYAGSGGALDYQTLAAYANASGPSALATLGLVFVLAALAFRMGAAPFHIVLPDNIEGAALPGAMLLVSGFRCALLFATARLLSAGFLHSSVTADGAGVAAVLSVLAAASLLVGAVGAIRQEGVKRMLGYFSIVQVGWAFLSLAALSQGVPQAALAFGAVLLASVPAMVAALAVCAYVPSQSEGKSLIDDWSGLADQRPLLALSMTLALLSLCGLPLTVGFLGFFAVMKAALASTWLFPAAVCGLLAFVICLYAALRLVGSMYFRANVLPWEDDALPAVAAVLVVTTCTLVFFGVVANPWLAWAQALIPSL